MNKDTLLIDEQVFKLYVAVSGVFDWSYIRPYIITAQDKHVEPITGTALMDRLKQSVIDKDTTTDEQTLINDHMVKCIAQWAYYEALPFLPIKMVNSGLIRREIDEGEQIDIDEATRLKQMVKNSAEFYTNRLHDFLSNSDLFPEYTQYTAAQLKASPNNNNSFGFNF